MVLLFFLTSDSSEKIISFEKKFRPFCWNCILSVPRTFWGVFFKNVLVFQFSLVFQAKFIELPAEIFQQSSKCILSQNASNFGETFQQNRQKCILRVQRNTLTKTLLASWKKFHLWAKNFRIFAKKIAGVLSYEHYLFPDGQLEEYFCKNF